MGCRSGGSRAGLAPPATPCAAARGPVDSSPTAGLWVRAGLTVVSLSSRHPGRTASTARPFSIANYARKASRAATTLSDAGLRGSVQECRLDVRPLGSPRRITSPDGSPPTRPHCCRRITPSPRRSAAPCRSWSRSPRPCRTIAQLLRGGDPAGLTPLLEAAVATGVGGFVTGLRQDEAAVRAAIAEPWSNGPVEGQVNRLKR